MTKDYGKVTSFRMDKHDEKLLNECFDKLNVYGSSLNAKMGSFIGRVHKELDEVADLRKKVEEQKERIKELQKEIPSKPQPNKVEPVTPTQITKKPEATITLTKQPQKELENIWCPYKEDWIHPVKCETCRTLRHNVFANCQARRQKNPNDPIFTPTKPKPLC